MPSTIDGLNIYNSLESCSFCGGGGWIGKREGLKKVICRYCYGLGKRNKFLQNGHFKGLDFKSSVLTRNIFINNDFNGCDFSGCSLREISFVSNRVNDSLFVDASFAESDLRQNRFEDCHFVSSYFNGTNLNSSFLNSDFWHSFFCAAKFNCGFKGSAFQSAKFYNNSFSNVSFNNCFLKNTIFENNKFIECEFVDCDLSNSFFKGNVFKKAKFTSCKFLTSNILCNDMSLQLKEELLLYNSHLAIFFEWSPANSKKIISTQNEKECIDFAFSLSNRNVQTQYETNFQKSFYQLWKEYGLSIDLNTESERVSVLTYWINKLYEGRYSYNEIARLVGIAAKGKISEYEKLEKENELRPFPLSIEIAKRVDYLIGFYDSSGGMY